ncbi:TetR family transcriptional regulator [Streptomyces abyssalis]|uniref:TetR family transcriptional regulator n=1 Tax=Streptomyces abyssalis TaxID=933944 RepID=A0A1E7JFH3_9ACTN|nr:TetR/AcrR family transcriptional regulator [Streptomyces abyssalis]OEU85215.1 TetR family transcriptional regulator [Streptomyces abyssalis]OEU95636.1 TetR family transcriptional regulator [Streptomyces abyssalis]OEV29815.1 TetR family transcriptional regulator [Streptomyces nanshensis]
MPTHPSGAARATRERILDAAEERMRTIGLARATTKEIARAASCSEAALYKHFKSKEEIFVHVLKERLPPLSPLLDELTAGPPAAHGSDARSVEQNLTEIARRAARFYERSFPISASLFAEPKLLQRHDEAMRSLGTGPHKPAESLAAYLHGERDAGRIRPDADPEAAAALLMGACSQRAILLSIGGGADTAQPVEEFAVGIVRTLLAGIAPSASPDTEAR